VKEIQLAGSNSASALGNSSAGPRLLRFGNTASRNDVRPSAECGSLGILSGKMAMRRRDFIAALGSLAVWPVGT
jgi:hypothetical protein